MSGGSFNYMYQEYPEIPDTVTEMAKLVNQLGPESKAAKDMDLIIYHYNQIRILWDKLEDVMHDVEWWQSNDYTMGQALETIKKYR